MCASVVSMVNGVLSQSRSSLNTISEEGVCSAVERGKGRGLCVCLISLVSEGPLGVDGEGRHLPVPLLAQHYQWKKVCVHQWGEGCWVWGGGCMCV